MDTTNVAWKNKTHFCLLSRHGCLKLIQIPRFSPSTTIKWNSLQHDVLLSAQKILFIATESFSFQAKDYNEISWQNHKRFVGGAGEPEQCFNGETRISLNKSLSVSCLLGSFFPSEREMGREAIKSSSAYWRFFTLEEKLKIK